MPKYLALFITITLGVTAGNLISNYATARYTAYQLEQQAEKLAAELQTKRQQQQLINEELRKQAKQELVQQRQDSRKGKQLFASCQDWRSAHEQFKSDTSEQMMRKACDAYDRYVAQGK